MSSNHIYLKGIHYVMNNTTKKLLKYGLTKMTSTETEYKVCINGRPGEKLRAFKGLRIEIHCSQVC